MFLDEETRNQFEEYLKLLESDILIQLSIDESEESQRIRQFIDEVAQLSTRIQVVHTPLIRTPSFMINRVDAPPSGVVFASVPLGHEFSSFILALLQVSGRTPKIEQELIDAIVGIKETYHFDTYVTLSCHNCPDVVQALNMMSVLNPYISHTMIDGGMFKEEVESKSIMVVPAVFKDGQSFSNGRMSVETILEKLVGQLDHTRVSDDKPYDVLVIGGGPSGASAAIYAARKGIRTGLVAKTFGGQVLETLGIENMIGTKYIEGPQLMAQVEQHVKEYPIHIIKNQMVMGLDKNEFVEVTLANDVKLKSKTVIVATGARWRNINVPGEEAFKNKGVAYCPHCDGPLFAGKNVAVIGGGNSGVEAAIDLANIARHVTVLEFQSTLKADEVLQDRLHALNNVTVLTQVQTNAITGEDKVSGLSYTDLKTQTSYQIDVEGVFILIGLVPNTNWIGDKIDKNKMGEIIVNDHGATNMPGVFAAGDCTNSAYKQIIIAMGSGATSALGAFDYLIRMCTNSH